jgi:predicted PurR-regulated permease PerM
LAITFRPVVKNWSKAIGKPLSILSLVLILVSFIAGFIYIIIPPFVDQAKQLSSVLPDLITGSNFIRSHIPEIGKVISTITQSLGGMTGSFISFTASVFGGIVSFFTIIILTIYFLADDKIFQNFKTLIPKNKEKDVSDLIDKITIKIGDWLRGQLLLGLIIGVCVYIGLSLIGVKYALVLAIISAVLEFIPIVGPIISGALAALISLSISPLTALIVIVFYVLLSQLENTLIVPKVMQKAIGLPPAIIIIAILIGGKLLGILGALLAVPISAILFVVIQEWVVIRKIMSR